MGELSVLKSFTQRTQGRSYKPIAWCIDRKFFETAGDFTTAEEIEGVRLQDVDPSAYALQCILAATETKAEIASEAHFENMAQKARNQRPEVRRVLDFGFEAPVKPSQIVGIHEKKPNVAHRNLVIRELCLAITRLIGVRKDDHRPCRRRVVDDFALSRLSNQYSSRSG